MRPKAKPLLELGGTKTQDNSGWLIEVGDDILAFVT